MVKSYVIEYGTSNAAWLIFLRGANGKTWDDWISHLRFLHLQGARQMGIKCLIRMRIYPERDCEVTDLGLDFERGV
jgi:hypothetical protein